MKNLTKTIVSIFAAALLLVLCVVAGAVAAVVVPMYFLCALAFYAFELCVAGAKDAENAVRDNLGIAHNKAVVFEVASDMPRGIKLHDIASGQCSEYRDIALQDVLRHASYDEKTSKYFFPLHREPALLVSGSGQYFFGHGETLYPVRPPASRPAYIFPPHRRRSFLNYTWMKSESDCEPVDSERAVREVVLKTDFVVTEPRSNDVKLQSDVGGSGISRVRIIAPSVVLSRTMRMIPTRVALLSPYVVPYHSESVFLRRYTALARAGVCKSGKLSEVFAFDVFKNIAQLTHILTHNRSALSELDAEFLDNSIKLAVCALEDGTLKYDAAAFAQYTRNMLLLLGLSQSNNAMFKPLTKQGKLWITSEFIYSREFQDAMISAAVASMRDSVDQGIVSREDIMENMPYLCKQISGLCEAVYTVVRAANYNNGTCEEYSLSDLTLFNIISVLNSGCSPHNLQLSSIDESSVFHSMSDVEVLRFDKLKEDALRASHQSHGDDVHSMYDMGRRVLRDRYCSDIIAYLAAHSIKRTSVRAGTMSTLCENEVLDNAIADYLQTDSVLRNHAFARNAKLELADKQECEISCDVQAEVCVFPELEYATPRSDTSLDAPKVAEVRAERRAAGLSPGAASA
ncbi:hypothetical protein ACIS_00761 [Anaplasma centrale str. Israel]|uniref:Uncharacterized protein n=1 Tax=Anaplasma centrale (strain Israel) TaxID=574556 RepID=D1AS62_ANACI|nr:hypothetical protein [Anaplasma centrale]ACZ49315.1 hypothetical protein ACIS_00761 [Anaplasma centrale str. Israel]